MTSQNSIGSPTPTTVTSGGTGLMTLTTAYGVVCAGTTATGALQNAGVGTSGQVLTSNGAGALPTWQSSSVPSGSIVQVVNTQTGAVATGSTVIPLDNSIPQNTEGDQYMSLSITPTNSNNKLLIQVIAMFGLSGGDTATIALFQDSTANALAAQAFKTDNSVANVPGIFAFNHYMTAGTTSATTFKIRMGPAISLTLTFNGTSGTRLFGGVAASSITITEIKA